MNSIQDICSYLKKSGEQVCPMTTKEVSTIEAFFNVRLPKVYIEFLLTMGKGAGSFMKGSDTFFNQIFSLREWADHLCLEHQLPILDDDCFVFWMHQGYQFAYFRLNSGDNPHVYIFTEHEVKGPAMSKEPSLISFYAAQFKMI